MNTVGPDSETPEPVWVNDKLLSEIEKLKERLFKVENEMARMGQGKKASEKPVDDDGKKLMDKIESIRKEIEDVSSKLGVKDEPSPFKIKK
jgi:archaellum component FlaC